MKHGSPRIALLPARARTKRPDPKTWPKHSAQRLGVLQIIHRYTPTDVCRVDSDDGRSPGSRIVASPAFPESNRLQWLMARDSPLTVAGTAADLGPIARTAFPFHPLARNRQCSSDTISAPRRCQSGPQLMRPVPHVQRSEAHPGSRRRALGQEPLCRRPDRRRRRPGPMSRPPSRSTTRWRRASPSIAPAAARDWRTIEAPRDLAGRYRPAAHGAGAGRLPDAVADQPHAGRARHRGRDRSGWKHALAAATAPIVLVANEVGFGIVPDNALARRFRDARAGSTSAWRRAPIASS